MRIIGGRYRGRRLVTVKGSNTRPTTGCLREALFNIVGNWIAGKRVLDLFAGTGAIGLEAISRGATHTTFVERNTLTLECLRKNIETLGVTNQISLLPLPLQKAFPLLTEEAPYDLIYLDPPYGQPLEQLQRILSAIENHRLLAPSGKLFIEESSSLESLAPLATLEVKKGRRYGRSHLWEMQCQMN